MEPKEPVKSTQPMEGYEGYEVSSYKPGRWTVDNGSGLFYHDLNAIRKEFGVWTTPIVGADILDILMRQFRDQYCEIAVYGKYRDLSNEYFRGGRIVRGKTHNTNGVALLGILDECDSRYFEMYSFFMTASPKTERRLVRSGDAIEYCMPDYMDPLKSDIINYGFLVRKLPRKDSQ